MKNPICGKVINILPPAAIKDDAAWAFGGDGTAGSGNGVDTKGFKWARFRFFVGATDIATTAAPKIQESAALDMGSATDVTGAALSAAISATDDNKVFQIDVCLDGRKRYLIPVITAGNGTAGTYLSASVELFGAENDALTATGNGLAAWIVS